MSATYPRRPLEAAVAIAIAFAPPVVLLELGLGRAAGVYLVLAIGAPLLADLRARGHVPADVETGVVEQVLTEEDLDDYLVPDGARAKVEAEGLRLAVIRTEEPSPWRTRLYRLPWLGSLALVDHVRIATRADLKVGDVVEVAELEEIPETEIYRPRSVGYGEAGA